MKKVLIILPYKFDEGAKAQSIHYIYQTYLDKLVQMGVLPIISSSVFTNEMVDALYEECDGVLLLGGGDINPALYNQPPHGKTKIVNPKRDEAEARVIKKAVADKKPILGVCRGMQIVNVVLGGSLSQHLPDTYPNEEHNVVAGNPTYDDVASDRDQYMIVQKDTMLAEIAGEGKKLIHCAHHQGVDKIAPGFLVNAKSEAGVIEGLELQNPDHFVLLLQNHIETQDIDFSNAIWKKFASVL